MSLNYGGKRLNCHESTVWNNEGVLTIKKPAPSFSSTNGGYAAEVIKNTTIKKTLIPKCHDRDDQLSRPIARFYH